MVIGIKYCGGCNPRYQRGREVTKLKEKFSEHEYRASGKEDPCDVWIVVCGCQRACADGENPRAKKKFLVIGERSFDQIEEYLIGEREKELVEKDKGEEEKKRILYIGETAEMIKTFYKADGETFAALTGDRNPIHFDDTYAAAHWFRRPVVHGTLVSGLFSAVMGMKLPGKGTVLADEKIHYQAPVFYGDTVCARISFIKAEERKNCYIATFQGVCVNHRGETVAEGIFTQMMIKKLFIVEAGKEIR